MTNEEEPSDRLVGAVIDGRYRIERAVGSGGFGHVYRARHLVLDVPVAIKTVRMDLEEVAEETELVSQLLDEGRVLKRLRHEHIVSALDLGTFVPDGLDKPVFYLVMEWCAGRSLKEVLRAQGAMSLRESFGIVEAIADALGHAHEMSIVHRDVKPSNIMMTDEGGIFLVDFGIAKAGDAGRASATGATLTASTTRAFTKAYAAPEQAMGARTGPWTDVHALGLLFIELLTGAAPYGASEGTGLAIVSARRPSPESAGVEAGPFAEVIARAVALKPADRFEDARAFHAALLRAAKVAFGTMDSRPSGARPRPAITSPPATATFVEPAVRTTAPATRTYRSSVDPSPVAPASASRNRALAPLGMLALALGLSVLLLQLDRHPPPSAPTMTASRPEPASEPARAPAPSAATETSPTATASAAPPAPKPTFCDLSEAEKKDRVRKTGFRGYGFDDSLTDQSFMTSLRDGEGRWLGVRAQDLALAFAAKDADAQRAGARTLLTRDSDALDVIPGRGISYAIDGTCFVSVRGPSEETKHVLDIFMAGFSPAVRGDTFGGAKAIPFAALPTAPWTGAPARVLGKLSEGELIERLKATGIRLADAQRVGDTLLLDVTDGDHRASVVYVKDPLVGGDGRRYTRGASADKPTFYAVQDDVVVLTFGSHEIATETFLRTILKGIPVHVLRATE